MLAGSQHESKSHLASQGPNKLQMYTVKAKPSTNRSGEVNSLWARQNSCAGEDSGPTLPRLCPNSSDNQADVFHTHSSRQDSYQAHVSKRFIEPAVNTRFKGVPTLVISGQTWISV